MKNLFIFLTKTRTAALEKDTGTNHHAEGETRLIFAEVNVLTMSSEVPGTGDSKSDQRGKLL